MYSSRMRTRISQHALRWGGSAPGGWGVPGPRGVYSGGCLVPGGSVCSQVGGACLWPGGGEVYPSTQWGRLPPCEQNRRHVYKHNFAPTSLRALINNKYSAITNRLNEEANVLATCLSNQRHDDAIFRHGIMTLLPWRRPHYLSSFYLFERQWRTAQVHCGNTNNRLLYYVYIGMHFAMAWRRGL